MPFREASAVTWRRWGKRASPASPAPPKRSGTMGRGRHPRLATHDRLLREEPEELAAQLQRKRLTAKAKAAAVQSATSTRPRLCSPRPEPSLKTARSVLT
jgi:hypothetical protein